MQQLNLPTYPFKLRSKAGRNEIFGLIRKKWLVCTPEEWVRQHFVAFLIMEKKYPASNIAVEEGLKLNALQKRSDILVYKEGKPLLLVECKAPSVPISQSTFDQLFRYNLKIQAPLLAVTNGLNHVFAAYSVQQEITFLRELDLYTEAN